jgi:hypothetical protein
MEQSSSLPLAVSLLQPSYFSRSLPVRDHRGRRYRLRHGRGGDLLLFGPPPQPGVCWYYTDAGKRNGFWEVCP